MEVRIGTKTPARLNLTRPERDVLIRGQVMATTIAGLAESVLGLDEIHGAADIASSKMATLISLLADPDATGGHAAVEHAAAEEVKAGPRGKEVSDDIATNK